MIFATSTQQSSLSSDLKSLSLVIVAGLIFHVIAWRRRFLTLPKSPDRRFFSIQQCLTCLVIYFGISFFLSPYLFYLLQKLPFLHLDTFSKSTTLAILHLLTIFLNLVFLFIYMYFQRLHTFALVWKSYHNEKPTSYFLDIGYGLITWVLSIPFVVATGEICEMLSQYLFKGQDIDQAAVTYLKTSSTSPLALVVALFAIIIAAPLLEEFIFRGSLQNMLRRFVGVKASIMITSFLFAFAHFSTTQGATNLPLLTTLFVFSLYLGFSYEKTRSLIAPITMHSVFNLVNVIRIFISSQ